MSRAARRLLNATAEFFRIVPILRDAPETEKPLGQGNVDESSIHSIVDMNFHGVIVARVPAGATERYARQLEEELTRLFSRPVLVVGQNIEFFVSEKLNDEDKKKLIEEQIIPKGEPVVH